MTRLFAIVLAAGWGRRAGGPKALLALPDGRTFLDAVVDAARAATSDVVVVAGPWWGQEGTGTGRVVVNRDPDRGQISSIRLGILAAPEGATGALVALVDHPAVKPATFARLAAAHAGRPDAILVPVTTAGGTARRGHPVVFPSWAFDELAGPSAEAGGARTVVRSHPDRVVEIEVDDPGITMDIDTLPGYRSMLASRVKGADPVDPRPMTHDP
jgi:CTP:molybdopterin cytidylyltransferase MocA